MKTITKRMVSCLLIIIILIFSINYVGNLLNPDWTDGAINAVKAFHTLPENSVEVIIYGSSHAWKGLDTMEMYKQYGIGAYNYGCNWQRINTTSLFFEDSLRTQSPKVVLIETYRVAEILKDTDLTGEIYYTKAIDSFEAKDRYLQQCFGDDKERYLSYYMPLIMFHENWKDIDVENFSEGTTVETYLKNMGYNGSESVVPVEIVDSEIFMQEEIGNDALEILDNIVEKCDENDIQLIFYTVPYEGQFNYSKAMKNYAEKNGCVYLDLFEKMNEVGIDSNTDFQDDTHLNDSGAKKVADYLGAYIVGNCDVTDMRTVEDNIWEQNLQ